MLSMFLWLCARWDIGGACGDMNQIPPQQKWIIRESWQRVREYGLPEAGQRLLHDVLSNHPEYSALFPLNELQPDYEYLISAVDRLVSYIDTSYVLAYMRTAGYQLAERDIPIAFVQAVMDSFWRRILTEIILEDAVEDGEVQAAWNHFLTVLYQLAVEGVHTFRQQQWHRNTFQRDSLLKLDNYLTV